MSASYNRNTELRNVDTKDLYNLAVILDDDNYWQILMEVIPQEINNETFGTREDLDRISSGAAYQRKYTNDHIRLIENAIRRPGESRLYSQILFDEWGSSGRKHERPTLGVLLHLLVQTKLYRAADFVADLLKEPKPARPHNGPAAEFEFAVDVFNDIQEMVNDSSFYPNTEDLQENSNIDVNKDYYTKYYKNVDKKLTISDNSEAPILTRPPKPPPRLLKSARLLKKQQQQILHQQQSHNLLQQTANKTNLDKPSEEEPRLSTKSDNESNAMFSLGSTNNLPNLSALLEATTDRMSLNNAMTSENFLPKLSALNNSSDCISEPRSEEDEDDSSNSTPSLIYTKPNVSEYYEHENPDLNSIPVVVLSKPLNTDYQIEEAKSNNCANTHNDLPALKALNLNGEKDDDGQHQQNYAFEKVPNALSTETQLINTFHDDLNVPANINCNQNLSKHQLEAIEEDYNGIEHEHDSDGEVELEDDEDSIPNLSFLENRSSNNESSLTNVTNTSGENSFEECGNDFSPVSVDNLQFLNVLNK